MKRVTHAALVRPRPSAAGIVGASSVAVAATYPPASAAADTRILFRGMIIKLCNGIVGFILKAHCSAFMCMGATGVLEEVQGAHALTAAKWFISSLFSVLSFAQKATETARKAASSPKSNSSDK